MLSLICAYLSRQGPLQQSGQAGSRHIKHTCPVLVSCSPAPLELAVLFRMKTACSSAVLLSLHRMPPPYCALLEAMVVPLQCEYGHQQQQERQHTALNECVALFGSCVVLEMCMPCPACSPQGCCACRISRATVFWCMAHLK